MLQSIVKVQGTKFIDSGGGFLIEENPAVPVVKPVFTKKAPPIIDVTERPACIECDKEFSSSYLLETFDYKACDNCR